MEHILLSRIQFALTAMFHILWPVLTIGLSLFLVLVEALWLKTKKEIYYRHARFWGRLFIINFAVGVVSGIPMEFQFGTNWGHFSRAGGDIFGHLLGFEATMAFMLEAAFLGIMVWGWKKVSPAMHLLATTMVAFGTSLSAFWIMSANAWMQTPAGGVFKEGRYLVTDNLAVIFNPDMPWAVSHMWFACLEISLFVIGGISAWYLLRNRQVDFFLKSFKIAVIGAIIVTPLQIYLGDGSGREVAKTQPTKLGAMEAHWETNPPGKGASWNVLAWPDKSRQENTWEISIPYALSLITTHSPTGQVKGLRDFPVRRPAPHLVAFLRVPRNDGAGVFVFLPDALDGVGVAKRWIGTGSCLSPKEIVGGLDGGAPAQLHCHGIGLGDTRGGKAAVDHLRRAEDPGGGQSPSGIPGGGISPDPGVNLCGSLLFLPALCRIRHLQGA